MTETVISLETGSPLSAIAGLVLMVVDIVAAIVGRIVLWRLRNCG
ncbi:hypothetical protein [Leptolyngbya iicbica]|nr:hypothetical protein [Leptolyngbya sp. LK]